MVLQVAADAGKIVDDGDASRLQRVGGTDPRELQQARRADRAATETITSRSARIVSTPPPAATSTPTARPFSTTTFSVWALRRTVRFFRPRAGFRNALEAEDCAPRSRVES